MRSHAMGLVTRRRVGRIAIYSLYDHHVASLLDEAIFHAEHLRLGVPDSGEAPGGAVAG